MTELSNELTSRGGSNRHSLAERLDPALGEASAGIGVILTELMRRTLRGGMGKVEDEIGTLVDETLESHIARRMPSFELAATEKAADRAKIIANELVDGAKQAAIQAVERLRLETSAATSQLENQAQTLAHQSADLAERIEAARTYAEQSIESSARSLSETIVQTESRVENKARDLLNNHVVELAKKSQKTYQLVQERLESLTHRDQELSSALAEIKAALAAEQAARVQELTEQQQAWREQQKKLEQLDQQLGSLRQTLRADQDQLRAEMQAAWQAETAKWAAEWVQAQAAFRTAIQTESAKSAAAIQNHAESLLRLQQRLEELERPRGVKAVWRKVFAGPSQATPSLPRPSDSP